MNGAAGLPAVAAILTAAFLIGGSALTLIGSVGLIRLRSFSERLHAPTLGTTLGTAGVAIASIIYFSALESGLVLYQLVIVGFLLLTTPASLIILFRAALLRDQSESGREAPVQNGQQTGPQPDDRQAR
ncbi:MAG TPA: monovalent cation/H(+) antiporter subunit G [Pseudolabrys sp.]|jgi:multicomponent K+:H+ antiporter subunit G|nr:monovalent cation/H(+) antiporter subunit G [Pseudolabrys sp.]